MEIQVAPRLKVVFVLCALLAPSMGMANRPKVKPHHKVPPDWRKFVAAKNAGVVYKRPSAGAVTYAAISFAGSYETSGGVTYTNTTTNLYTGSVLDFGTANTFSGATLQLANSVDSADQLSFVKTGAGTLNLTSTPFVPNPVLTGGTLSLGVTNTAGVGALELNGITAQFAGSNVGVFNGPGSRFILGSGQTLTFAGGSSTLPASLVTAINSGQLTLANGGGTVAVQVDPVTNQQTFVVNGQAIPWPGTGSPLSLVRNLEAVATQPPVTLAPSAPFESGEFSAQSGLGGVTPVPEPSSALLALLGAGFLAQRRRRS